MQGPPWLLMAANKRPSMINRLRQSAAATGRLLRQIVNGADHECQSSRIETPNQAEDD